MWVVVVLASLAALIIFFLCVPLDTVFRLDVYERPRFRMRFTWLFGLVSKELGKEEKEPQERRKRKERRIIASSAFEILRTEGMLRKVKRLVKDILSCVKVRELKVNFKAGLDNPADTALFLGPIGVASVFLNSSCPYEIMVQPSFDGEEVFEGYLYAAVRLRPIQIVVPVTRFALSRPGMRAMKMVVLAKWKKR